MDVVMECGGNCRSQRNSLVTIPRRPVLPRHSPRVLYGLPISRPTDFVQRDCGIGTLYVCLKPLARLNVLRLFRIINV